MEKIFEITITAPDDVDMQEVTDVIEDALGELDCSLEGLFEL